MKLPMRWFGHDTFHIIASGKQIYFDPFQIHASLPKADIIFITHEHFDHCSIDDIKKIIAPYTVIVTIPDCQSKLSGLTFKQVLLVEPNQRHKLGDILIETIPAYNLNKFRSPGVHYHPRIDGRVGFILTIDGVRIYHAGDTDEIPEMVALKDIDVALVPVSGTYVMTPEEAAIAVNKFKPKLAIPMHYGAIVGTPSDADLFKKLARVPVEILSRTA